MHPLKKLGKRHLLLLVLPLVGFYLLWRQASWWPHHRKILIGSILSLQMAPDGQSLLALGLDASANQPNQLNSLQYPVIIARLRTSDLAPVTVQRTPVLADNAIISPDGQLLVSFLSKQTFFNCQTNKPIPQPGLSHSVTVPTSFSPDGQWLFYVWYPARTFHTQWKLLKRTGTKLSPVAPQMSGSDATDCAFSDDGQWLLVGQLNGDLVLYNLRTLKKRLLLSIPIQHNRFSTSPFGGIAISPDGQQILLQYINGLAHVRNLKTGQQVAVGALGSPWTFSPDGTRIVSSGLSIWDIPHKAHERDFPVDIGDRTMSQCFSPDGNHLFTGTRSGTVYRLRVH